jgi:hypothetical protein
MRPLVSAILILASSAFACGRQGLDPAADDGVGGSSTGPRASFPSPPSDGRCGLTPKLLVPSSSYPVPTIAGKPEPSIPFLVAQPPNLYYAVNVLLTANPKSEPFVEGTLLSVPVDGGEPTQVARGWVFTQALVIADELVVPEANAFPDDNQNALVAFPVSGGPARTLFNFSNADGTFDVASDGQLVYFGHQGGVGAVPLAGGQALRSIVATDAIPSGVGVVGSELIMAFPSGEVESLPLPAVPGATPTARAKLQSGYQLPALPCGQDACWLAAGGSELERMSPTTGGSATVTTFGEGVATAFSFDGQAFYVLAGLSPSPQQIVKVSVDGQTTSTVVDMPNGGGQAFAADDECLYWTSRSGIFSLAKSAPGPFEQ